jgi:K+-transporting ATPase ATPase B chain
MNTKKSNLFEASLIQRAFGDAIKKLNPAIQIKNPVMFIVYIGSILSTLILIKNMVTAVDVQLLGFNAQITVWLWFTVLFANFAEAIAEGRGKARADSLKKTRTSTLARLLQDPESKKTIMVKAQDLKRGDLVLCESGDFIPTDGEIIEGLATIDESAITGESAPVVRESGGDRSAVTGGTKVISDSIIVKITAEQGNTFLDKMISLVEGAKRQKTPNEIALTILLASMSIIFIFAVVSLYPFAEYSYKAAGQVNDISVIVLISLLVCLIPTTIASLLSAIGISGMERLLQFNVIAMSGKAVEAAGDIDVLLLDKTGTITLGSRMASSLIAAPGVNESRLVSAAQLASLADETPEGRSIVVFAKEKYGLRERNLTELGGEFVPFSARTRMSGVDFKSGKGKPIRKGAVDSVRKFVESQGGSFPSDVNMIVDSISREGATPLLVCEGAEVLGVIELRDIIKGGIKERFERLRKMGIKTIMITGDNPLTAAAIAAGAGVDDFIAEATPETKLNKIREEQQGGRLIAMIGDGTNDAPALAQADVGVAMNTGTQVAREAGNMIDLDSNPTKLIEIVEIGKRLLMTRGTLTTFSIANDVAKYFAIIPALFGSLFAIGGATSGPLSYLNVMGLHSPQSAILSAVIFNALIIVALIPLALRGVAYRPLGADMVLMRNISIYGLGGLIMPFMGIKIIDVILTGLHLV